MRAFINSRYQSRLEFDGERVQISGSLRLLQLADGKKQAEGADPRLWQPILQAELNEELLINAFIRKVKNPVSTPEHDEVCHCRMVSRDKIESAIYQGCRDVNGISQRTLAGTGCGSCRPDLERMLHIILKS